MRSAEALYSMKDVAEELGMDRRQIYPAAKLLHREGRITLKRVAQAVITDQNGLEQIRNLLEHSFEEDEGDGGD